MISSDYLIIGSGIIGMTIALELKQRYPKQKIILIEKEKSVAVHASGLNSGVLHAGFYYSADSLKAKFCRDGNKLMKEFCAEKNIYVNNCGKIVVSKNKDELIALKELYRRGKENQINVQLIDEMQLKELDPNIKTYKQALYSPDTASVDPVEVCQQLKNELIDNGIEIHFETKFIDQFDNQIKTNKAYYNAQYIINSAGLYTDKIAKKFSFGHDYALIPFKGKYLKSEEKVDLNYHVYPVPDLQMPFLGIHYTMNVNKQTKIGPSSIPALWRENYSGLTKINFSELIESSFLLVKMYLRNANSIRSLVFKELKKMSRKNFVQQVAHMTQNIDNTSFKIWAKPGIRAQLIRKKNSELLMDFIIEGDEKSIHMLNTISPGFTCSFAIAKYTVELIAKYRNIN